MRMKLKPISKVRSKAEARNIAIDYQGWASEQNLSYGELARYGNYFEALAKKFRLKEEFQEEGII